VQKVNKIGNSTIHNAGRKTTNGLLSWSLRVTKLKERNSPIHRISRNLWNNTSVGNMVSPRMVSGQLRFIMHFYYGSKWLKIWTGKELLITVAWKSIFIKKKACHPCCCLGQEERLPVPTIELSFFDRPARRPVNVLSGSYHIVRLNKLHVTMREKCRYA